VFGEAVDELQSAAPRVVRPAVPTAALTLSEYRVGEFYTRWFSVIRLGRGAITDHPALVTPTRDRRTGAATIRMPFLYACHHAIARRCLRLPSRSNYAHLGESECRVSLELAPRLPRTALWG